MAGEFEMTKIGKRDDRNDHQLTTLKQPKTQPPKTHPLIMQPNDPLNPPPPSTTRGHPQPALQRIRHDQFGDETDLGRFW